MVMSMKEKDLQLLLSRIEIIVDTRENENSHIINSFKKLGIPHKIEKLDTGDYSFSVLPVPEIGFNGMSYADTIAIERKANLTELSGNIAQQRDRFQRELQRAKDSNMNFTILVEDGSFDKIIKHKYETDLSEKSYIASLLTFKYRYGVSIEFIPKEYVGAWIHRHFYYFAREIFKEG